MPLASPPATGLPGFDLAASAGRAGPPGFAEGARGAPACCAEAGGVRKLETHAKAMPKAKPGKPNRTTPLSTRPLMEDFLLEPMGSLPSGASIPLRLEPDPCRWSWAHPRWRPMCSVYHTFSSRRPTATQLTLDRRTAARAGP